MIETFLQNTKTIKNEMWKSSLHPSAFFFLEFIDSLFGWEVDYFILVTFFNGKVNVSEEYILKRFVFGITWNAAGVDFISLWTWAGRAEANEEGTWNISSVIYVNMRSTWATVSFCCTDVIIKAVVLLCVPSGLLLNHQTAHSSPSWALLQATDSGN